jgi:hypothetical protein
MIPSEERDEGRHEEHVGGRAIRRDRARADVPLICSLLFYTRGDPALLYERRVSVSVVPS